MGIHARYNIQGVSQSNPKKLACTRETCFNILLLLNMAKHHTDYRQLFNGTQPTKFDL